jgi:hypothetical protein
MGVESWLWSVVLENILLYVNVPDMWQLYLNDGY